MYWRILASRIPPVSKANWMTYPSMIPDGSARWTAVLLLLVSFPLSGCGVQPETISALREAVNAVSASKPTAIESIADEQVSGTDYQPPYPDRIDPFSFPATAPVRDDTATITSVAQVEILGFANVDDPRVLLRTKDLTRSMKVGDAIEGVEVVAIEPPTVELKMGTLVWTASMFDSGPIPQQ